MNFCSSSSIRQSHYLHCDSFVWPYAVFLPASSPPSPRNVDVTYPTPQTFEASLFQKLILTHLFSLHPLQGGFRPKMSYIHTAFALQEVIQPSRPEEGFLSIPRLRYRVAQWSSLEVSPYRAAKIYVHNWYRHCTSSVLWNSATSRPFPIQRQPVLQRSSLCLRPWCSYQWSLLWLSYVCRRLGQ